MLVALVLVGGCYVIEADYTGAAGSPRVAVMGDSITSLSSPSLHEALDVDHRTRIMAATGITFAGSRYAAADLGATDPDVVVVALGTNDVWNEVPLPTILADMDQVLSDFPAACVVMTTVNEHTVGARSGAGVLFDNAVAHQLNGQIRSRPVRLADWDAAANADPDVYLDAGTIHPTETGQRLWASVVAAAVATCP